MARMRHNIMSLGTLVRVHIVMVFKVVWRMISVAAWAVCCIQILADAPMHVYHQDCPPADLSTH